jgi:hypothetical protein
LGRKRSGTREVGEKLAYAMWPYKNLLVRVSYLDMKIHA